MSAEEDYKTAHGMAEWLGLKEQEVEEFVKNVMERKGHKPVLSWADSDEGGDKKKSSLGGLLSGSGSGNSSGGSSNWQYK